MLRVQRSIPIPRISLERLVKYIIRVGEEPGIDVVKLRMEGLDFGKGRGDITRFFQALGIIDVSNGGVRLTPLGERLFTALGSDVRIGKLFLHMVLYRELPQYAILVNTVSELAEVRLKELHAEINRRIRKLSPTAWINEVAFKALLGLSSDLGILEVRGDVVRPNNLGFAECVRRYSEDVGGRSMIRVKDLEECLSNLLGRIIEVMSALNEAARTGCIEWVMAPSPAGPRSSYARIMSEECLIRKLTDLLMGNL